MEYLLKKLKLGYLTIRLIIRICYQFIATSSSKIINMESYIVVLKLDISKLVILRYFIYGH